MTTIVRIDDREGVRTITLDGQATKNALTQETAQDIARAIRGESPLDVAEGAAPRVIVLTGAHGAFCSGLDLKHAAQTGIQPGPELRERMRASFHAAIRALRTCGKPTIAAVDGVAAGFGCDLAIACDLRLVSDRAVFSEVFVSRGLMPDGGGTFLLPRIIGLGRALDLFFTGRSVDAEEAARIGLATLAIPVDAFAEVVPMYASKLAAGAPLAYAAIKNAVYDNLDETSLSAALDREADGQMKLLASDDFREALHAFLGKRPPRFTGR